MGMMLKLMLFPILFVTIGVAESTVELNDAVISDSSLRLQLDQLNSKISLLESRVDERISVLRNKDERIKELESTIDLKLAKLASLQSEFQLLQDKGSLNAKELVAKANARATELERQIDVLRRELEAQNKKKDTLGTRTNVAEEKIQELNLKLESLQRINEEQNARILKTKRALQVAEEEMMKAKLEASSVSKQLEEVHRARLKGDQNDVVVKVQHPGIQQLMMTDIHNLQAFALYLQKMDITFDLYSLTKEIEKQIGYEFNFLREADAMDRIRRFLYETNKKSPVMVPRVIRDIVTRRVLVMEYIDGTPILKLGDQMARRGISPDGKVAAVAKQNILKSLSLAYGQMMLKSGFFHADPHPGNILICRGAEVALLDYGQVKDLPDTLRLGYANLVLAIADGDATRAKESFRELGIDTLSKCEDEQQEMLKLAQGMFDTKLPPGVKTLQPFSEESSVKKIAVEAFPEELFSVLRTLQLLRGLSVGLGISHSCAEHWRPIAEEALYSAGRLTDVDMKRSRRHKTRRKPGK